LLFMWGRYRFNEPFFPVESKMNHRPCDGNQMDGNALVRPFVCHRPAILRVYLLLLLSSAGLPIPWRLHQLHISLPTPSLLTPSMCLKVTHRTCYKLFSVFSPRRQAVRKLLYDTTT
jgi:hypothetical protein